MSTRSAEVRSLSASLIVVAIRSAALVSLFGAVEADVAEPVAQNVRVLVQHGLKVAAYRVADNILPVPGDSTSLGVGFRPICAEATTMPVTSGALKKLLKASLIRTALDSTVS